MSTTPEQHANTSDLAARIAELSLLRGRFTLRSGRTSTYYLDKYRFSTRPSVLAGVAERFAERIERIEGEIGRRADRLAGAELGGIPLVTATALRLGRDMLFVRNAKKDYGTAKQLEGAVEQGDTAILLEDVATTAGQALEAVHVLRDAGAEVLAVIAVIDRQEGATETMREAGVRFESLFTVADLGVSDGG